MERALVSDNSGEVVVDNASEAVHVESEGPAIVIDEEAERMAVVLNERGREYVPHEGMKSYVYKKKKKERERERERERE